MGARRGSQGRPGPPRPDTFLCHHRGGGRGPAVVSCSNKKKKRERETNCVPPVLCVQLLPSSPSSSSACRSIRIRRRHICQDQQHCPSTCGSASSIQPVWWAACTKCSRLAVLYSVCEVPYILRQRVSYNHLQREKWCLCTV